MMKVVPSMTSGRDKLREKPNKDNTPRSPGKALINLSLPNRNNKSNVKQVHTKNIINNNSDTDNDDDIEVMRETKRIADVVEIVQDGLDNPMVQKELQKRRGHRKVDYSVP